MVLFSLSIAVWIGTTMAAPTQSTPHDEAVASALRKMNPAVDACSDFHQYACGSWLDRMTADTAPDTVVTSISIMEAAVEAFQLRLLSDGQAGGEDVNPLNLTTRMRQVFGLCLQRNATQSENRRSLSAVAEQSFSAFTDMNGTLGEHPELLSNYAETLSTMALYSSPSLIHFELDINESDPSKRQLVLSPDPESFRTKDEFVETFKNSTRMFFKNVQLGNEHFVSEESMLAGLPELVEFHDRLSSVADHDSPTPQTVVNLNDFLQAQTAFPWKLVLDRLTGLSDVDFTTITVRLHSPSYFTQLNSVLSQTPIHVLQNWLIYSFINGLGNRIPYWVVTDSDCALATVDMFPEVLEVEYVKRFRSTEVREQVARMVAEVRESMYHRIMNADWLDEETKAHALQKEEFLGQYLMFEDDNVDEAKLREKYGPLQQRSFSTFIEAFCAYEYAGNQFDMHQAFKPMDRRASLIPAHVVNAGYSWNFNRIYLPLAFVQPQSYNPQLPMAFNYGSLGSVIGHELTHAFDNFGRKFDQYGRRHDWWTAGDAKKFAERAQCFIDQYNHFENGDVPGEENVNGTLTLNENLADTGGLAAAFDAFQRAKANNQSHDDAARAINGFTQDQTFFLGYAQFWCSKAVKSESNLGDVHAPAKHRVNAVLNNTLQFVEAFKCPATAPLNSPKKCQLW